MRSGSLRDLDGKLIEDGPLVSVIVPVYNTPEGPLRRCFRSLLAQDYRNIEFIVVDDGSDEDCVAVLNEVLASEPRARIIAGGHKGVSHARNTGLDAASGEWAAFVDSDDEVMPRFVGEAMKVALAEGADLVFGQLVKLYQGDGLDSARYGEGYCIVDDSNGIEYASREMLGRVNYKRFEGPDMGARGSWAKLFRRERLGTLRFDEGIALGEDTLFNFRFIRHCRSLAFVDALWYVNYQYKGSASHGSRLGLWEDSIGSILDCREEQEPLAPFFACAEVMSTHAIESVARDAGLYRALAEGRNLLSSLAERGCFAEDCLEGYEPFSTLSHYIRLCKKGHFLSASCFWAVRSLAKDRLANRKLIDPRTVTSFGKR